MKKIVVNDTNVFIDLYEVGLLEEFSLFLGRSILQIS